jgi:hypothetical protein
MKPKIDGSTFGSITIDGQRYAHDVLIRLDGRVEKRKKKLSKAVYGTSHKLSLDEARHVYQDGAERLIFGTGQGGLADLSQGAADFFAERECQVVLLPTPQAVQVWNDARGRSIGLFHVTC